MCFPGLTNYIDSNHKDVRISNHIYSEVHNQLGNHIILLLVTVTVLQYTYHCHLQSYHILLITNQWLSLSLLQFHFYLYFLIFSNNSLNSTTVHNQ